MHALAALLAVGTVVVAPVAATGDHHTNTITNAPSCPTVIATKEQCHTCPVPACLVMSTVTQGCDCPAPVTSYLNFPCSDKCKGLGCTTTYHVVTADCKTTSTAPPETKTTKTSSAPPETETDCEPTTVSVPPTTKTSSPPTTETDCPPETTVTNTHTKTTTTTDDDCEDTTSPTKSHTKPPHTDTHTHTETHKPPHTKTTTEIPPPPETSTPSSQVPPPPETSGNPPPVGTTTRGAPPVSSVVEGAAGRARPFRFW